MFRHDQSMEDPRDGITLFGPLEKGSPYGIRAGVIGTKHGIRRFNEWVEKIQGPISNNPPMISRPHFPGFEAAFRIPWNTRPAIELDVPLQDLKESLYLDDKHQRIYKTVDQYAARILDAEREEESIVDIWFVIVPDEIYKYCRPESDVEPNLKIEAEDRMNVKTALQFKSQYPLFEKDKEAAIPYYYDVDFHNQLKARLLECDVPIQIIRESTIAHWDHIDQFGNPIRNLDKMQSAIAWNISTTAFYKAGSRPWKLGSIREGVCYIGLVFKQDKTDVDPASACCAAQMFLDSGDGVVFKGAVGPWYSGKEGEYHINRKAAKQLVEMALKSYHREMGIAPKELFIHGKVRFDNEEWKGFCAAVDASTNLVGVRIRTDNTLKIFRKSKYPVMRGLAFIRDERTAYLWSRGFVPRLQTYAGREVPNPLLVDVCRGNARIDTVLRDILSLTKLNYNACQFGDGYPVTLRFADAVGQILTAAPIEEPPIQFRFYI